jgi:hypothetical protein
MAPGGARLSPQWAGDVRGSANARTERAKDRGPNQLRLRVRLVLLALPSVLIREVAKHSEPQGHSSRGSFICRYSADVANVMSSDPSSRPALIDLITILHSDPNIRCHPRKKRLVRIRDGNDHRIGDEVLNHFGSSSNL